MDPFQLEQLTDAGVGFMRLADPPAVILILVLTFIILRTVWVPRRYRVSHLTFVALALSLPLTALVTVSEDAQWGHRFFWRAVLQNGAVACVLAFLALPRLYKRWPGLLEDAPLFLSEIPPKEPPPKDSILDVRKTADDQRRKDLWHEPVEKKKDPPE